MMIWAKRFIIRRSALDKFGLIFLGVMLLSTLLSVDRHVSIFGYYGRFNGGVLSLVSYSVLFYGFGFFFDKKDVLKILRISVASSVVVMLWGLSGKFGHDLSCLLFTGQFSNACWTDQFRPAERMFSTLGQPNWLGAYLAIHFFIGLYFAIANHFKRWYISYAYLLLTFICLISTKSRSALLAVGIGSVIYFSAIIMLKSGGLIKKEWKKWLALGVLFLISIMVFKTGIDKIDGILSFQKGPILSESVNVTITRPLSSEVTESLDIRKIVWKGAIDLGLRYPLLGTGPETFGISYYFTRPVEHNTTSEWDYIYNKAHNEYLNYLATTGFIGLLSYLILVGAILYNFLRSLKNEEPNFKSGKYSWLLYLSLLCSYVTILVTNFFGFSTTTVNLFFFLIPAMVTIEQSNPKNYFNFENSYLNSSQKLKLGIAVVAYLFCLVWLLSFFVADTQYAKGLLYEANGDYVKADKFVTTAVNIHPEPVYSDKQSYLDANLALIAAYQENKELVKKFMTSSNLASLKALGSSPKNIQYWKTQAKNNLVYYQITLDKKYLETGISSLKIAMALAPTEPKLPYTKAVFYSALVDEVADKNAKLMIFNQARESANQAIKLKPNYSNAEIFLKKLTME